MLTLASRRVILPLLLAAGMLAAAGAQRVIDVDTQLQAAAGDGGTDEHFGRSASLSADGGTALLGADDDDGGGSSYVFVRSGSSWTQQAKLRAADGAANDRFGWSVSLSADGGVALVGAGGSAYVFARSGASWLQQAKLRPADGAADRALGQSVAVSGDGSTALVGSPYEEGPEDCFCGASYVFVRSGSSWAQQAKLVLGPSNLQPNAGFGVSVSLSGNGSVALVAANFYDRSVGGAFVFVRSGSSWSQEAVLLAADGGFNDYFGSAVSLSGDGDTALIGAPDNADDGGSGGSAYVFVRSGPSWTQQAKLLAADAEAFDLFGQAVSLGSNGDTALVGAYRKDSAYFFQRSGSSWTQEAKLRAADGADGTAFGYSAALSGGGGVALLGPFVDGDNGAVLVHMPTCPAGQYALTLLGCTDCPAGSFCPEGATAPTACDAGELCPAGSSSRDECPAGSFCPEGATTATACDAGELCPAGSSSRAVCPAGSFCGSPASSEACPAGSFCPEGATAPTECDEGELCPASSSERAACPAGSFCSSPASSEACPAGSFCPEGATVPTACDEGELCSAGSSSRAACPAGSYCSSPTASADCPAGSFCPEGSVTPTACDEGELCAAGSSERGGLCPAGSFCSSPSSSELCPADHYCPEGATAATRCSTCSGVETVKTACTAEADTQCEVPVDLILIGVGGLVALVVLGLAVRHAVKKRSRQPVDKAAASSTASPIELVEGGGATTA